MTPAAPNLEDAPHWARPLLERNIAMAGELAEAGLAMALDAKHQAMAPDDPIEPVVFEHLSRTFERLSRSTRLSLMLQDRQIKDLIALDKGDAPDAGRDDRKDEIRQIVRIIVDPKDVPEARERLEREALARFERETLKPSFLSRPASELMAIIRKDLGLDPDPAAEAWAMDEAAGDDLGWPLAGSRSSNPATTFPLTRRGSSP